jgi:hypothetical protein
MILCKTDIPSRFSGMKVAQKGAFRISNCDFHTVDFSDAIYKGTFDCLKSNFYGIAIFKSGNFKGKFIIKHSTFSFNVIFWNCLFWNELYFSSNTFEGILNFTSSKFKYSEFTLNIFEKAVYFTSTAFWGSNTLFKSCQFLNDAYFNYILQLEQNGEQSNNVITFSSVSVNNHLFFNDSTFKELIIHGCIITSISAEGTQIDVLDKVTSRVIKNLLLNSNDKIGSINYHVREMEEHWYSIAPKWLITIAHKLEQTAIFLGMKKESDLKHLGSVNTKPFLGEQKTIKLDWLLLTFNRYSNFYGSKWYYGIFFTILVGFFFYTLKAAFIYDFDPFGVDFFLGHFILFLYPLNSFEIPKTSLSFFPILIELLGRIFIGYGIYQTIAAFRKFK